MSVDVLAGVRLIFNLKKSFQKFITGMELLVFLLLPSVIQNDIFLAEQCVVFFVVNMRNFCVNLVMLLMQEDRKSILLINYHSFFVF